MSYSFIVQCRGLLVNFVDTFLSQEYTAQVMTSQIRGALLLFAAMLSFSVSGSFVKLASDTIPFMETVFFRGVFGVLIILTIAARKKISLIGKRKGLLAARGVVGTGAMMLFFYALTKIPVANAILLNQATPIFVLPLAVFFLKERITRGHIVFVLTALVGVVLVIKPEIGVINPFGLVALTSAAFSAVAYILVSTLNRTDNRYAIVFWFMCISCICSAPFMVNNFVVPDINSLLLMAGVGLAGTIGQLLLTWAYQLGEVGRLSVIGSTGAVFAAGWDFLFWGHIPGWITAVGGMIVIASCSALQMKRTASRSKS